MHWHPYSSFPEDDTFANILAATFLIPSTHDTWVIFRVALIVYQLQIPDTLRERI